MKKNFTLISFFILIAGCSSEKVRTPASQDLLPPKYPITRISTPIDTDLIQKFQDQMPEKIKEKINSWSDIDLSIGKSISYNFEAEISSMGKPVKLAVEYSQLLIDLPYNQFIDKISPDMWGTKLAHYLGGEVKVLSRDDEGRVLSQVERMVLSSLPFDLPNKFLNQDMTKTEMIKYGSDFAKVYWIVYFSDNNSTEADIGSVEFRAVDRKTLVTFHSGHKVRTAFGIPVPRTLLKPMLRNTFLDHLKNYRTIVNDIVPGDK